MNLISTRQLRQNELTDFVNNLLNSGLNAVSGISGINGYSGIYANYSNGIINIAYTGETGSFATTGYVNNVSGVLSNSITVATGTIYNLINSYESINMSGSAVINTNSQSRNHSIILNITSGLGQNYSGSLVLPTGNRVNGDRIAVHANYQASISPNVQIYSASSGVNNLLFSWSGDGTATKILVDCLYTGLGYYLLDAHFLG